MSPGELFTQCNAFVQGRYATLDDVAKAELKEAAETAKLELSERQADDTVSERVPVRDTPKSAQLKAIEKAQGEMARLQDILRNHQMGVFIAYVPMNKDCAAQKLTCDRNCETLQAFFLHKDASRTSSMLLDAKKYLKGASEFLRLYP